MSSRRCECGRGRCVMQGALEIPSRVVSRRLGGASRLTFAQVWLATWRVFAAHPAFLLAAALFSFGLASAIGALLYAGLIAEAVVRFGTHTARVASAFQVQMLVQAAIGIFTVSLGRGVLAWAALNAEQLGAMSWRQALRAAIQRGHGLLLIALLMGAIYALGDIGVISLLRELRLDSSSFRWLRADVDSGLMWVITRTIDAMLPAPSPPMSEWLSSYRFALSRTAASSTFYSLIDLEFLARQVKLWRWVVGASGLLVLMMGDALLSMSAAAMMSHKSTVVALRESVLVGATQAWRVIRWRWTLRVLSGLLLGLLLLLPVGLHQVSVVAAMRSVLQTGFWIWHIAQSLYVISGVLFTSLVAAFGVVFEARMWALLRESSVRMDAP